MLTFSRKPLGIWLVTAFVLGASFLASLVLSHTAYAAVSGTWIDKSTIRIGTNPDFKGPNNEQVPWGLGGSNVTIQSFVPSSGVLKVYFADGVNINTARTATLITNMNRGSTQQVNLTNTRDSVPVTVPPGGTDPGTGTGTGDTEESKETCNLVNIGWIVCPVSTFLGEVTDLIYALVENLLVYHVSENPLDTSGSNPVYVVWSSIRNLANVAFIFAFFAIIFSQATSIGLASYGIKKMLPRLIVAAILVNLSYFICVFAVDISNIIGAGIDGIIRYPLTSGLLTTSDPASAEANWTTLISSLLVVGIGGSAIAGATVPGALAAALPFLVVALFAALTALVILIARQALLTILIIVSPLAFVAYILPNTEDAFSKWRKLFTTLLVFYPMVAIVFAGSQVAAAIMRLTANEGTFSDAMIKVMSLAVQAFPLFALPFILKFSGGLLGRIGGVINNPSKGPFDKLRQKAEQKKGTVQAKAQRRAFEAPRKNYTGRFGRTRSAIANNNLFSSRVANQKRFDAEKELDEAKGGLTKAQGAYYNSRFTEKQLDENGKPLLDATGNPIATKAADKYAGRMAGGTMFNAADPRDVHRVVTGAQAAERKAFQERVGAYQTSFSLSKQGSNTASAYEMVKNAAGEDTLERRLDAQGNPIPLAFDPKKPDTGYLERQFDEAIRTNNAEQASAVLNRLSSLGAGGREAVVRVMENTRVTNKDMQLALSNSIYEDNYGSLVGKVGDVAKGGFDASGNWKTQDAIAKLGTEQIATQDFATVVRNTKFHPDDMRVDSVTGKPLVPIEERRVIDSAIPVKEARRIVEDKELFSKIQDTKTQAVIEKIAALPQPPQGSPGTAPGAPNPPQPSPGGGPGVTTPTPAPAGGGGSSAGGTAAAAAAGAAAGAAAAAAMGGASAPAQPKPGAFDAYTTPNLQQLPPDALRSYISNSGGISKIDDRDINKLRDALGSQGVRTQDQEVLFQQVNNEYMNRQESHFQTYSPNIQATQDREAREKREQEFQSGIISTNEAIKDIDRNIGLGKPETKPYRPDDNDNNTSS